MNNWLGNSVFMKIFNRNFIFLLKKISKIMMAFAPDKKIILSFLKKKKKDILIQIKNIKRLS